MLHRDHEQIIRDSNNRIAVEDLQLLERACDAANARHIVEIGSADGGSSVVLGLKARQRAGHLTCVEPQPKQRMVDNMQRHGLSRHYSILRAASPDLGEFESQLPESIDLLFIDGSHEVRACLLDYYHFAPRVRAGGVIVFHDTSGHCQEDRRQPDYGTPDYVPLVQRAIDAILASQDLTEIDRSDARMGGAIAYRKGGD